MIVIGHFFYIITGPGTNVARSGIARFNSDGSLDADYDPGDGLVNTDDPAPPYFNTYGRFAVRESNGKIVVQGSFDTFDGHSVPGLVRVNTDGSFDATFVPGTATDRFSVTGLFVQSNDQIVVFGSFPSFSGAACTGIVRLHNAGQLDTGFNPAAFQEYGVPATITGIGQGPDGKLIVGGSFHSLGGVTANNVARLETSGARDTSFGGSGGGPHGGTVSMVLLRPGDAKMFLGGNFSAYDGALASNLALANADGSVDDNYSEQAGGTGLGPHIYAVGIQADGKIVVAGLFSSFNGASHYNLVRLNPDATIDLSFNPSVGTARSVRALLIEPDGKIVIAGTFSGVNGVARGRVARLNADGTLDTSFDPGTGANGTAINALARDSAGNIYVGGSFTTFNGAPRLRVAKLSSSGALDPVFNLGGGGASGSVNAIASPDEAGRVVIAGNFFSYRGVSVHFIARLNSVTGALDTTFNAGGTGFSSTVYALSRATDGKYYAGGAFSSYNGVSRPQIARLNDDGSLDGTFSGPAITGQVIALALKMGKCSPALGFLRVRQAN